MVVSGENSEADPAGVATRLYKFAEPATGHSLGFDNGSKCGSARHCIEDQKVSSSMTRLPRHALMSVRATFALMICVSAVAVCLESQRAAASSLPVVRGIASFSEATSAFAHPAHVVTAEDVSNAVATPLVNTGKLWIGFNLNEEIGYPRLALFIGKNNLAQVCVMFANSVGGRPKVVECPKLAVLLWQYSPFILDESRNAVALAAKRGTAVSGADVVKETAASKWALSPTPTRLLPTALARQLSSILCRLPRARSPSTPRPPDLAAQPFSPRLRTSSSVSSTEKGPLLERPFLVCHCSGSGDF